MQPPCSEFCSGIVGRGWLDVQIAPAVVFVNLSGGDCVEDIERLERATVAYRRWVHDELDGSRGAGQWQSDRDDRMFFDCGIARKVIPVGANSQILCSRPRGSCHEIVDCAAPRPMTGRLISI